MFLVLVLNGTQRVQQVVLRILGHVIPALAPDSMNRILLNLNVHEYREALSSRQAATSAAAALSSAGAQSTKAAGCSEGTGNAFIHFLLILVGLSIWKMDPEAARKRAATATAGAGEDDASFLTPRKPAKADSAAEAAAQKDPQDPAVGRGEDAGEGAAPPAVTTAPSSVQDASDDVGGVVDTGAAMNHFLPLCLRGHVGAGAVPPAVPSSDDDLQPGDPAAQQQHQADSRSSAGKGTPDNGVDAEKTFGLASEVIALVRVISASPLWSAPMKGVLEGCLRQLPHFMPSVSSAADPAGAPPAARRYWNILLD